MTTKVTTKMTPKLVRKPRKKQKKPWLSAHGRQTAYYAMGASLFGISLIFLTVEAVRENSGSVPTDSMLHDQAAFEVAPPKPLEVSRISEPELTQDPAQGPAQPKREIASETPSGTPLVEEFKTVRDLSLQERVEYWSQYIQKSRENRKQVEELVKGMQVNDTIPIVPSQYNATTYVETVMALARSNSPEEFFENLVSIRYRNGQPDFASRNHLHELDWLPNNKKAQILEDITSLLAQGNGLKARVEVKKIRRSEILTHQTHKTEITQKFKKLMKSSKWTKPVKAKVTYISLGELEKVMSDIPTGAVVNLVHKSDRRHPMLITHQGIVIRDGDKLLLRYSSRNGRIKTSSFYPYLMGLAKMQETSWPLLGINVVQIKDSASATNRRNASM